MSLGRWAIVIGTTLVLLALVAWQQIRRQEVARCLESGGMWDGPSSRCLPKPSAPILQRDLYRT